MRSHLHGMPLSLILRTTFCLILNGNHLAAQILSTQRQKRSGSVGSAVAALAEQRRQHSSGGATVGSAVVASAA